MGDPSEAHGPCTAITSWPLDQLAFDEIKSLLHRLSSVSHRVNGGGGGLTTVQVLAITLYTGAGLGLVDLSSSQSKLTVIQANKCNPRCPQMRLHIALELHEKGRISCRRHNAFEVLRTYNTSNVAERQKDGMKSMLDKRPTAAKFGYCVCNSLVLTWFDLKMAFYQVPAYLHHGCCSKSCLKASSPLLSFLRLCH